MYILNIKYKCNTTSNIQERSVLLEVTLLVKDVLKYTTTEHGAQYVMMVGT